MPILFDQFLDRRREHSTFRILDRILAASVALQIFAVVIRLLGHGIATAPTIDPDDIVVEDKILDPLSGLAISPRVAWALDIVRAAGGDVEAEGIEIAERVEAGEIDTEEAVRLITAKYGGG